MPRRSAVLEHPDRARIDELLDSGNRSVRSIARDLDVAPQSLFRYARKRRDRPAPRNAPSLVGSSPVQTFEHAFGLAPKKHQRDYLLETRQTVCLKGRQTGMTTSAAALAVHTAVTKPGATIVIISPSLRQSGEVTDRARLAFWQWDTKLKQDSASLLRTEAGSRIISLPGSARGIRGYACDLVVLDEAAWIDDATWVAARPLVSASGGRLIVQSTPGRAVGWFYELATAPPAGWRRIRVTSAEAGTVSSDFLKAERATMPADLFSQEYEAQFASALVGTALFDGIADLFTDEVPA